MHIEKGRGPLNDRLWQYFLAAGLILMLLYLLRLNAGQESGLFVAIGFLSSSAILVGLWLNRPRPLLPWVLILVAQTTNACGDALYTHQIYLGRHDLPDDLHEGFYLVATVIFFIALVMVFTRFRRHIRRDALIGGAIVATAEAGLLWIVQIQPNLGLSLGRSDWLGIIFFPLGLLLVGTVMAMFLMTPLGQTAFYRLIYLALLCYSMGSLYYSRVISEVVPILHWSFNWIVFTADISYSTAYILLGAAFLHPSLRNLRSRPTGHERHSLRQELVVLGIAFMVVPSLYLFRVMRGVPGYGVAAFGFTIVVFLLVELRLGQLLIALESQNKHMGFQQEQLQQQAFHDAMTGLPNRFYLYRLLPDALKRSRDSARPGAVFMIDVNNFKMVNDTFGHDEGDLTLRRIANLFMRLKRREDLVARWGGDEFVFLLENIQNEQDVDAFARRLEREVRLTIERGGQVVQVSISIGVSFFPIGNEDIQTVIKKADIAMYRAKAFPAEVARIACAEPSQVH